MTRKRLFLIFLCSCFLLQSCVFFPRTTSENKTLCHLQPRQMELDVTDISGDFGLHHHNMHCDDDCLAVTLGGIVVVSAGSAIVSGSIVVVGNTLHWLEEQGRCEESATRKAIDSIMESSLNAGGWVVESSKDLLDWMQSQPKSAQQKND